VIAQLFYIKDSSTACLGDDNLPYLHHSPDTTTMPAIVDKDMYDMLDSVADTDNAVEQNKRIKEAEFAEDSREPTEEEIKAIDRELEEERAQGEHQLMCCRCILHVSDLFIERRMKVNEGRQQDGRK
jgi:hypothetical protein